MNRFSMLLCCVVTIAAVTAIDYCSSNLCPKGVTHFGCTNKNFANSCPADAALVNIDDNLMSFIVKAHNDKRNFIAGGGDAKHRRACRMATMDKDNELAYLASLNVKQCEMSHDKCRNTNEFHYSGQNLGYVSFYGNPNHTELLQKVVNMWYNEVSNSKMAFIKSFPSSYTGPKIGHFTVMMADRNIRVGCAASTYSVAGKRYKIYLVACNYATTNMVDFPIYASCRKAASKCISGANPNYKNLCSTSEVYDVNKWF